VNESALLSRSERNIGIDAPQSSRSAYWTLSYGRAETALMVGLIGLLLLTMYFTALPNRMSIWRGAEKAWRRLVALTARRDDVSALSRAAHSV
jgi:hypothetical protein